MSELDFSIDLSNDSSELDIGQIFGSGSPAADNPFDAPVMNPPAPAIPPAPPLQMQPTPAPVMQAPTPQAAVATNAAPALAEAQDPLKAAFAAQEEAMATQTTLSLFEKPPVFSYNGARNPIDDSSQTFEDLRIAMSDDFPELGEGKKVSWVVEYGKTVKNISDPKGTTIASVKTEIEQSKAFQDGLKKLKDKNPDCLIKPRVTAQSKGIASYKGFYPTLEAARESGKIICFLPSQDGKVYELRKNELGEFIAPPHSVDDFSRIRAGFIPALPKIPFTLIRQIISFFRHFMHDQEKFEALAHILWDRELHEYTVFIPKQEVAHAHIDADLRDALPRERYLHYADIHSHNSMSPKFSGTDDADERATRLYFVVGWLDQFFPTITARISCGGSYQEIAPSLVLDDMDVGFPLAWLEPITRKAYPSASDGKPIDAGAEAVAA